MRRKNRTIRSMLAILIVTAIFVPFVAYAYTLATRQVVHGRISVTISTGNGATDGLRNSLADLIREAEELISETHISVSPGSNITPSEWWAYQADHDIFREAINTAHAVNTGIYLAPGDTFNVTIRIDDNLGFAGMALRAYVPLGLELTGLKLHNDELPNLGDGFVGVSGWDGMHMVYPPITGYAYINWARFSNFTGNGNLVTYVLTVTDDISGQADPITLTFANATGYEIPHNVMGEELNIHLPRGVTGYGAVAEIGSVYIVQIPLGLSVLARPGHARLINRVGEQVSFSIFVGGMPPNQTFCLENPNPSQIASIAIEGVPEGIKATGSVITDAYGVGRGTLTLAIVATGVSAEFDDLISTLSEIFAPHDN